MRVFAPLLVVLALATPSSGVAEQPIQVFLLAGQSNMVGRGQPLTDGTPAQGDDLLLFRDGVWQQASDPLGPPGDPESGVGPGMTFGLGVLSHEPSGTTVGLIMCARGGTPINAWAPGSSGFESCRHAARDAGGTVAGVVFLQGEYEALHGGAGKWQSKFTKVEAGFEKLFGPVPFVLGQIGNVDPVARPYAQAVRDAQAAAAASLPPVTLVPSIDLEVAPDGVHFTPDAAKTLGYRYADAWWSLLQQFPEVAGVDPSVGAPGSEVTITGTGLGQTTAVTFGGAAAVFTVDGANQVTATVPDTGVTGPLRLTTPYGTVTAATFTVLPVIDSFTPTSGPPGTKVFVTGKALKGATVATVNLRPGKLKVLSATLARVRVPKGATSGTIAVTTAGGTAVSAGVFTVVPK